MSVTIQFKLLGSEDTLTATVYRPELLCGATVLTVPFDHALAISNIESFTGVYAIHPLSQEHIPVWAAAHADHSDGDAHAAIPAHNQADNDFARQYSLPIVPVIAQDFGEPLPDAKDVAGVVVIGYDPVSKKFLGLKNGEQGWLVGGGREEGETFEAAARRELTEEAGFAETLDFIALGDPVYSYYYNDIKRSNRRSLGYNYLAIVDPADQIEQQQEAHESFTVLWSDFDKIYADIAKTGGGVEHWLEALKRAKLAADAYDAGTEYRFPVYQAEGTMVNSGVYDGLSGKAARAAIITYLTKSRN